MVTVHPSRQVSGHHTDQVRIHLIQVAADLFCRLGLAHTVRSVLVTSFRITKSHSQETHHQSRLALQDH